MTTYDELLCVLQAAEQGNLGADAIRKMPAAHKAEHDGLIEDDGEGYFIVTTLGRDLLTARRDEIVFTRQKPTQQGLYWAKDSAHPEVPAVLVSAWMTQDDGEHHMSYAIVLSVRDCHVCGTGEVFRPNGGDLCWWSERVMDPNHFGTTSTYQSV